MKIYFRKIFRYDPIHFGLGKYESYEAVTRQIYSPGVLETSSNENFNLPTYCSSLKRGVQTASLLSKGEIKTLSELCEIKFSLHNLVNKDEFEKFGSELVRERFIKSFIDDSLLESRREIENRIIKVIGLLKENDQDKLVVSHSFVMKIFEAGLLHGLNIFSQPKLISNVIFKDKKTYDFGQGFEVVVN